MFHRTRRTAKHASPPPTGGWGRKTPVAIAAGLVALTLVAGILATARQPQESQQFDAVPVDLTVPLDLSPSQLGQWCIDRREAGVQGLSTRARNWLTDCIAIFGSAVTPSPTGSPSATPSPSPTTSPTPTGTPTPSPTVTTPTPSPTTSTATPTPTPTPTTPTPTSTATGCMPRPSACGWPDETNTGTTGDLPIVPNTVTLSTPGQVYENRDVRGCIVVKAKNVTIRNVKVRCAANYAIAVNTGGSSNPWNAADAALVVENVDIDMAGQLEGKAIAFDGYTLRRAHIHGGSDCGHFGVNVVIENTFCNIPAGGPADGPHYDGYQSDGGRNIIIRHNTIRVPYAQTAAILMSTNTSPIRDVSIVDNLVAGGGYSIYCGTDTGGPVQGSFTFSGNVVARTYFTRGGYWGPVTSCPATGWRWD